MNGNETDSGPPYDVAISFLSGDLDTARQLDAGLSPGLRVFFYAERQQELAGTDGLESLRRPFRCDSHLVVVLYRDGWGETNWTRVESEAITDRFLKEGPEFLFFVMMDAESKPPPWVPDKLIRFNLVEFPIDQAIGAIRYRAQQAGGEVRLPTLEERAAEAGALASFHRETKKIWRSDRAVAEVREEACRLAGILASEGGKIAGAAPGLELQVGHRDVHVVLRSKMGSLESLLINPYVNSLDKTRFEASLFDGEIILPGERKVYVMGPPAPVKCLRFDPAREPELGWCWTDEQERTLGTDSVAKKLRDLLLGHIGRRR